jgi:SNF2 family DNA or RNA helicase
VDRGEAFVLVTHYESLPIVAGKGKTKTGRTSIGDGWRKLGIEWDLRIADEAHRFWNPRTQMHRAARKIPGKQWLMLSGSIIQNHPEELFGPLQLMFPDRYKSRWRDWNDRYLEYVVAYGRRVCIGVREDMVEKMRAELGVFMVYRRKEDELDLPEKREQTLMVDLLPAQRKVYDDLVNLSFAELPDGTAVKAPEGIALFSKLRAVAAGLDAVVGRDIVDSGAVFESAKLDLAFDLIKDTDDAVVVFSWYKAVAKGMQNRLDAAGIESFLVDGNVPQDTRAEYIARFQAGEARVFIGTIATLAESVTLTRATQAIFLDRSFNPAQNDQAGDRIYRIGQRNAVLLTYIVARDTVDELSVLPSIVSKEALRRTILGS